MYQLTSESYLTDSDSVVQHCLGIGGVVAAWQLGVAEVCLQQQVGLGVGTVIGVGVDLQGKLLSQLAVQLVLVVSDGQLGVLLCILREREREIKSETGSLKRASDLFNPSICTPTAAFTSPLFCFFPDWKNDCSPSPQRLRGKLFSRSHYLKILHTCL